MSSAQADRKPYWRFKYRQKQEIKRLYRTESLPGETITQFEKRIRKDTRLDPRMLKQAIRETPIKKSTGDVLLWTVQLLNNYSRIKKSAKK